MTMHINALHASATAALNAASNRGLPDNTRQAKRFAGLVGVYVYHHRSSTIGLVTQVTCSARTSDPCVRVGADAVTPNTLCSEWVVVSEDGSTAVPVAEYLNRPDEPAVVTPAPAHTPPPPAALALPEPAQPAPLVAHQLDVKHGIAPVGAIPAFTPENTGAAGA